MISFIPSFKGLVKLDQVHDLIINFVYDSHVLPVRLLCQIDYRPLLISYSNPAHGHPELSNLFRPVSVKAIQR